MEKDPLLKEPSAEASTDELRELIQQLQERYRKLDAEKTERIRKLRKQRKDIKRKNKAIGRLKSVTPECEETSRPCFFEWISNVFKK